MRIMPQHGGLLAGRGDGRVVTILIAIGAGEDDDAKFHTFILTTEDTEKHREILSVLYCRFQHTRISSSASTLDQSLATPCSSVSSVVNMPMDFRSHARTTGSALKNWFIAQCYDSLAVALMWLVGLWIIHIPWAPLWAILAGLLQFIPNFGVLLSLIGPALLGAFSENHMRFFYVLGLFAVIMVADGLFLQPYIMKRTSKVPFWVALFAPIILGIIIPFWGVLLAPPLLAVIYAFRRKSEAAQGSGSDG